jgi:hypothetical protein
MMNKGFGLYFPSQSVAFCLGSRILLGWQKAKFVHKTGLVSVGLALLNLDVCNLDLVIRVATT